MPTSFAWVRSVPAEVWFAAVLSAVTIAFSVIFGLPFVMPGRDTTTFVGIHYFVPLIAIFFWYACCALLGQRDRLGQLTIAMASYGIVMWLHFTLKLWAHLINPHLYDDLFWSIGRPFRPIIEACMAIHRVLAGFLPDLATLYLVGFIAMFVISFCVYAVAAPAVFRKLLLAAIFFQGLGGLSYLVMPALGPFVFERGASLPITEIQAGMLSIHHQMIAGGPQFVSMNGSQILATGLGAMPSLHAGGSFLFLWFAWRYERPLLVLYIPLFAFICVEAIASRWHYVIDLPVGILLARGCIALAFRFERDSAPSSASTVDDDINLNGKPGKIVTNAVTAN